MSSLKRSFEQDGQVARVALAAPKANIVNQAMMAALAAAFENLRNRPQLKVMILTAEGPHFSFGASVQEHLAEYVGTMLPRLSGLLGQLLELPAVTIAAVRGQSLGGGFELALACDFIIAEEGAQFACAEIKLAVFPPAAAVLLPVRIGVSRAAELVLTGAAWSAAQAAGAGLIVETAPQGQLEATVETWIPRPLSGPFAGRAAVRRTRGFSIKTRSPSTASDSRHEFVKVLLQCPPHGGGGQRRYMRSNCGSEPRWEKRGTLA